MSSLIQTNKRDIRELTMNDAWVRQFQENYWMGLGDTSIIETKNPFHTRTKFQIDNPHIYLIDLFRRPENFFLTCKHIFNKTLPPHQLAILRELWIRPFPMLIGCRGLGKTWELSLYAMLRATFTQGSKIVVCGAAFRQSKIMFDYCQEIWNKAPVLRSLFPNKTDGPKRDVDRCYIRLGDSLVTFIPLGDGTKIRGLRANIVIGDEFASIPLDIFEIVVKGFGVVSLDPIVKMQAEFRIAAAKELGLWIEREEAPHTDLSANQTIISGTAYYAFNHFYDYWKMYKSFIESQGDEKKLLEIFNGEIPKDFNWRDYSVIRYPSELVPAGFMDAKQLAQAKATVDIGTYYMEYAAIFCADSNGFFKRSLIEKCVVGKYGEKAIKWACGEVHFNCTLKGNPFKRYVIAIDPASQKDNFSIIILELWEDHRRIVHCWTSNTKQWKARVDKGLTDTATFYSYAAQHIRKLHALFPAERIAIDTQGGGHEIIECLNDPANMKGGEKPILPIIEEGKEKETDDLPGLHILEPINFAQAEWVSKANHGLRRDFEDKVLLFPEFDSALVGLAMEEDMAAGRVILDPTDNTTEKLYDTLEDCVMEIEELKDELATIVHTQTGGTLRDHWDTPEVKQAGGKKGRLRKDRYSALLMANASARALERMPDSPDFEYNGGFARDLVKNKKTTVIQMEKVGPMWTGPAWVTNGSALAGGAVVVRSRA